ncbi:MAG TPA: ABC transporter substrate-binding protein [Methylomirabilota bacterium]|nr:ABC transporter substrate-binding protein [Methylomirabilota bacterium]
MTTLVLALALVVVLPASATAQARGKTPRVGVLLSTTPAATQHISAAFAAGLRGVEIEQRWAEGRLERFPKLAAELVRLPVDVIVASGLDATEAAARATRTIPIVMVNVTDPVGARLITSLVRPGGNVTGLTNQLTPEIRAKQLQLLKEALPQLGQVAILRSAEVADAPVWREYEVAARAAGVRARFLDVKSPAELDAAFASVARDKGAAAFVPGVNLIFFMNREPLVARALAHRVPTMFSAREFTDAGGLMSYSARLTDQFARAAAYVDRILKGARPGDLPVEQPTRFELVLNLKTAQALGLTLPPALLARADEVLQ